MRYDFGRKQPHGLLRRAEIERAEINLKEACSNRPIDSTTRAMMALISSGVPTQAPPEAIWPSRVNERNLRMDLS